MLPDRCREFRAAAFVIIVASLIAGCAIPVRERPISYDPQGNVQPTKGADAVSVEVRVEDLQPSETVSSFPNLFTDGRRFRVKDAADTIKGAAETELRARGFKIGTGGAVVAIQLVRFEATYEIEPMGVTTTVNAYLSMWVKIQPQTGKVLYSKEVDGEATPLNVTFALHPATHELQGSLEDAFTRLFADPAFTAAILATRQPAPAKPVVSPGRIAGAFATMSRR
jgi:uncharacterized lipoprotein YajG